MDCKEYLTNEFGLEIAREKIARKVSELMSEKNAKDFKIEIEQLIRDRDEVEKGNIEIIRKYIGEMKGE